MDVSVQIKANTNQLIQALNNATLSTNNLAKQINEVANASLKAVTRELNKLTGDTKTVNQSVNTTKNNLLSLNDIKFPSLGAQLASVVSGVNIGSLFMPLGKSIGAAMNLAGEFQLKIFKVTAALATLGGGVIIAKISEMQQLESQLKAVTSSTEEFVDTQNYLKSTSNTLSMDIDTLSKSYIQLLNLQKSGLITTDDARALAEGFANVAAKTGASTENVQSSMLGMSQALSAGVLQADEMQQMLEPLPGLMQAMDKASGEGAGGFKKLTYAGKVTSAMLKDTLIGAFKLYDGEAAKTTGNIVPMVTRMKNSFAQLAFAFNRPVTMSAQPIIDGVTNIMNSVGNAVGKFANQDGGFFGFMIQQFQDIGVWLNKISVTLPQAFMLVDLSPLTSALGSLRKSLSSLFSGVFDLTEPQALANIISMIVKAFTNLTYIASGFISSISASKGIAFGMMNIFSTASPLMLEMYGFFKGISSLLPIFSAFFNVIVQAGKIAILVGAFLIFQKVLGQTRLGLFALQIGFSMLAPGVVELTLLVQKYQTALLMAGRAAMSLGLIFLAFKVGTWIGEWLNGFEFIRNLAYDLLAGVLIVWEGIKAAAQVAAAFVKMIWQKAINGVSLIFAGIGIAMAHPLDFVRAVWVNFISFIRNLVSGFVSKLGSVLGSLDFLPGMETAAEKLKNFSNEMDKTTKEYEKLSLEGNAFTQEYQAQSDAVTDASQEFANTTIGVYRDFASERDKILESQAILTGKQTVTPVSDAGGGGEGQKANQYEARRKAYEAELLIVNRYKKTIKENQTIMQDSLAANNAYTESLTSMRDSAISDTISSMSSELENFTKLVGLSNSEVTAGQSVNQATYEGMTRSVRKHYADREAVVKQSVMSETERAAAMKRINTELEQALLDLEKVKNNKGGSAGISPEIAIAKKQMEFSKQSIELEKQRMTMSVESANTVFTNNVKLIQLEGGTDAEKNKKIIAEQDKLLQSKIASAKKGYEAVSQNLKKSTDDYIAYSEKAISLEQAIRGEKESLADKLREADRKGMDESKAQSDLQSQITEKLTAAKTAMESGDAERAKSLAEQAESLGGQLTATDDIKNVLIESSAIREQLLTAEKSTVETQKQMAAERMAQETLVSDKMKAAYDSLANDLENRQVRVNFDATQAEITINGLKEKLDEIKDKTVTVTVKTVENKAVGGFAGLRFGTGARVPGIGNSDTVPAMLTPGEFVVRKARAVRFSGLLNFLNFGSENQVALLRETLSSGIQKLNLGGPVFQMPTMTRLAFADGGGVPTTPQMVPIANLYIGSGKPVTVYHPTDTAATVVNALQGLARGRI